MKNYNNRFSDFKYIIYKYIKNNAKIAVLTLIIYIVGVFIGVLFINNLSNSETVTQYITSFIENFQNISKIDRTSLLISSIKNNFILTITIWFAGTTILGMPIILGIILFRGFCLGYTISGIAYTLGVLKGIAFSIIVVFLQNVLFIPALLALGISSMKLYKNIRSDTRTESIKIELIRHTAFSFIIFVFLIIASIIENEISVQILKTFIKYF